MGACMLKGPPGETCRRSRPKIGPSISANGQEGEERNAAKKG